MIDYSYKIINNQDRTSTFYLDIVDNMHNFFIFNQDSEKLTIRINNYRKRSSNSIIEFHFNSNTYFLVEKSTFNYILPNILSPHVFISNIDYSIFNITSSLLIKGILNLEKKYLYHYHYKKGFIYLIIHLSSPLLCNIKENFILV